MVGARAGKTGHGRWLAAVSALAGTTLGAGPAGACAVCFSSAGGRVLHSFYLTSALLTLMPFLIVGSIAAWLVYRVRRGDGGPRGDGGAGR